MIIKAIRERGLGLLHLRVLLAPRRDLWVTPLAREKASRPAMEQEDKEELQRERELRERFSKKIQEAMPQYAQQAAGNCSTGTCAAQPSVSSTQFFRFLFFSTSLLLLVALLQMSDTSSPFNTMRSLPWWQIPISSVSHYVLMRALLPYREQRRIKEEYEATAKLNPSLTFDQFFTQRYPTAFQGYRTQQQEVLAAVSACMVTADDTKFADSILRAVGSARDIRASVDSVMDAMRRDFPHLF